MTRDGARFFGKNLVYLVSDLSCFVCLDDSLAIYIEGMDAEESFNCHLLKKSSLADF